MTTYYKMNSSKLLKEVELVVFDFDGVFTDNTVYVSETGVESVRCCRGDGFGLEKLRGIGVKLCIVSTEVNPVVSVRAKKLDIEFFQGVENKALTVINICEKNLISPQKTMFVGNDINDIPAFQVVGISVGVADAHYDINPYISIRTKMSGGKGAVREICDLVFNAKIC
jgi:3-deoxy-D-manno-octulosonate 8-phosphate phosphatase (KDO 8-P phosphatase)